ncbi:MAG: PQQ-binding-like beta-propeller repeat protein [Catenulispora sp.]|nr:PQQ-binding-like beta-propeller repeat protein [Catenulispora sp.]
MNANILRGPVLPSLIAVGVVAASVAGTVALTGKHKAAAAAPPAPAAPPPIRNAAWVVDGARNAASLSTLTGFWIGPDVVVRGGIDGLHAMKRTDGTPAWDLPTPGGGDLCGMSAGVDGGIGIVAAHGTPATWGGGTGECSVVSGVDLATGKVLWTVPISKSFGEPAAGAADYAATDGMAVVDSDRSETKPGIVALDLKTGVEKWTHPGDCEHRPNAFAVTGTKVAIAEVCPGQSQAAVKVLDAGSGAPVPNAAVPVSTGQDRPQFVTADPVVVADSAHPKALSFGAGAPAPVAGQDRLFASLATFGASRAQVSVGAGVLCVGGQTALCWSTAGTTTGSAIVPKGLPNTGAEHHDVFAVLGAGAAARIVTTGVSAHPRAALCRIAPDGAAVVEADLSQPVSDYLGKNGTAESVLIYGDAKDLFVVDPHPSGGTAVIDVRLG